MLPSPPPTGNTWLRYDRACAALTLIATFVFIYKYSCCEHRGRSRWILPNPPHRDPHKRCADVLKSLTNGRWQLKTSVTPQQQASRKHREMQMRVRKGWPEFLFHGDLRCGPRFPLPRTMSHEVNSRFDIQAQCDPGSDSFCCHTKNGWCGSGPEFCACPSCIDYRKFISAELADWVPESGCRVKNFTQARACRLLSRHLSALVFIGDSLVRHLYSAMLLILTGDPLHGALREDMPEPSVKMCQGDSQFLDSMCQRYTTMRWPELAAKKSFCPHASNFTLSFIQAYNTERAHHVLGTVKRFLNQVGAVVFLGIGIHNGFSSSAVIQDYLEPAFKLAATSTNGWPRIVWLTSHSAGPLKPLNFFRYQSNQVILPFNKDTSAFCHSRGIPVFDTFNMTLGVHSFDGTHYGFGVNMLKARVLLNFLEAEYASKS